MNFVSLLITFVQSFIAFVEAVSCRNLLHMQMPAICINFSVFKQQWQL